VRKSPSPEPEADTIDTQSLMTITGWSEEHIRNLAEREYMPKPKRGQWLALETLTGLFRYAREKIAEKSSELAQEKLRTERLRGDVMTVKVKQTSDKYVEVAATEEGWESLILSFRERMLSLPPKVTPLVIQQKTPPEVEALLTKEIREALEELSKEVDAPA
jgi:hypothetical protein